MFVAEALAHLFFHLGEGSHNLVHESFGQLAAVSVVVAAGVGGNGHAVGDGKAEIGHFRQIGSLAAQQTLHLCIPFVEQIHVPHMDVLLHR